jgi:hypothetical protein
MRLITTVGTPLLVKFVIARHSLMNRSVPTNNTHRRDAMDDGAKNDRGDPHVHQFHNPIAQRFPNSG